MTQPIDPTTDLGPRVVVWHAGGSTVYNTTTFEIDDKSAVLVVYAGTSPGGRRQTIAAFNREFWIHADVVEHQYLDAIRRGFPPAPEGGDSDASGEVRPTS